MEKKTEVDGIYKVRDGILINKDNDALKAYKNRKLRENSINEIGNIKNEVSSLKSDITEIKELLRSLIK